MRKDMELKKMNIVHINLECPYMDESGYQEVILAKCHKRLCNKVTIITNNQRLNRDGIITRCETKEYFNSDDVKIISMELYDEKNRRHLNGRELYRLLLKEKPDFIMIHGIFLFDVWAVAKYKKRINRDCIIVADSHATRDNANIMQNNPKNILFRTLLKVFNRYMVKYYHKVYGVVQDAIDLMIAYAGIPEEKTAILELGYDETDIDFEHKAEIRETIRKKYSIPSEAVLLVHGGKLNEGKRTTELLSAVCDLPENVHVVVFGEFTGDEYQQDVATIVESIKERVHFSGLLEQKEIYDLYLAADIAVFPGTPSCLRQQAIAVGLPIIIGYNVADLGINISINGNAICLGENWTKDDLKKAIKTVCSNSVYAKNALELSRGEYKKYSYLYQAEMLITSNA